MYNCNNGTLIDYIIFRIHCEDRDVVVSGYSVLGHYYHLPFSFSWRREDNSHEFIHFEYVQHSSKPNN